MVAFELLPKLTHLTLTGQEDGELEFIGNLKQWMLAGDMERDILQKYHEGNKI